MLGKALARSNDLVVQESGNDLLIYDLKINKALSLNETSALVWKLCNGKNTVAEICDEMSVRMKTLVSDDLVWLALDQLNNDGLLENGEIVVDHFAGLSRREIVRKIGFVSMIALPVVGSIIAPQTINAQSCIGGNGTFNLAGPLTQDDCFDMIFAEATTRCCSGTRFRAAFQANPFTCEGTCNPVR